MVKRRISDALLLIVAAIVLLPILLMVVNSFRSNADVARSPIGLPKGLDLSNYAFVLQHMNLPLAVFNSVLITGASVAVVVVLGSAASWPLARVVRRWSAAVYRLFIAGLTVPIFVLTTPLYLQVLQWHLLNNIGVVILIYAAFQLPFAVFFYVSFLRTVPQELEQAAAVDGCGPLRTYWYVILPMLRPTSAAMAIFVALSIWNDVTIPLLFLGTDQTRTLTLSIYSFVGAQGGIQQAQLFPAVVLAALPLFVIFLIFQRSIVAGISSGIGK